MRWTIAAAFLFLKAGFGPAQTLRTAAQDNALAKYAVGDPQRPGLCREIADALMQIDAGLNFQGLDNLTPLTRIEKLLEGGSLDVFFCLLKNSDREARFNFIDIPLYSVRHVLLVRADDAIAIKNFDDLRALGNRGMVLVNFGSALARTLENEGVKYIASAKNDNQLIRMLNSGRGRFIYGQDITLIEMLQRLGLKQHYRILPTVFKEENQYLAYGKHVDPQTASRMERALRTLSQSGRLDSIVSRYR